MVYLPIFIVFFISKLMGCKKDITSNEKQNIAAFEIAINLSKYRRKYKKGTENIGKVWTRKRNWLSKCHKKIWKYQKDNKQNNGITSKQIFQETGVANVNNGKIHNIWTLARYTNAIELLPLNTHPKEEVKRRSIWKTIYQK